MKKNDLLSIVDSLEKINDAVAEGLEAGIAVSVETLSDCQDSAIAVGSEIEKHYGTVGEETVHLLEAYCENLYQMSSKLGDAVSCRKIGKKIQKQLSQIRNRVKYDLPEDRKEVVFLPYKASMWDSLESVWRAADADENTDAYVIPIPYFDKNPDGSFREEHYEGDQYPADVQITRYDEYDLEARRPDAVYIHNPYDECNHVTSVHPSFYAKNLRNFTDMLIYIPYFVLKDIKPDNQEAIDGMKHFCFTPGTVYADRVIVQSENMRRIYINEYMKAAKEMGLGGEHVDRQFLEKKFLGTGSPKVDKVLNTKKEDFEIPAKWLNLIERPDGSWKKIVLYNTGVSELLHQNEKMLKKMESVFALFQENQDDVMLLWRPHPLIQATIESMRPQLWAEYRKLRDKYIEEGWGIYDDSADLNRAVEISDKYYGDPSSVVQLCQEKGMPVMVQDVQMLGPKRHAYEIAPAEAICDYQDSYYFVYRNAPILCRMKRETLACEFLYRFQGEKAGSRLYRKLIPYQNKLFAIPFFAERIAVYDFTSGEMQFIPLNREYMNAGENQISANFQDALQQGRFLYLVPYWYGAVVRIDMESLLTEEFPLGREDGEAFYYCVGSACLLQSRIAFPIYHEGSICLFDTQTKEENRVYPSGTRKKYTHVFAVGNMLWLIPEKLYEGIDLWDVENNALVETLELPEEIAALSRKHTSTDIRLGFLREDKLYLLAGGLEHSIAIDVDSKTAVLWELPYEYQEEDFPQDYRYLYKLRYLSVLQEEKHVVICGLRGEWIIYEQGKAYMLERQSQRSRDLSLALSNIAPGEVICESEMDLGDYITWEDEAKSRRETDREKDPIGQVIYQLMSRQGG